MSAGPSPSVMSEEVARFDALGDAWWDVDGPMAPLHRVNPVRIAWARDLIAAAFQARGADGNPARRDQPSRRRLRRRVVRRAFGAHRRGRRRRRSGAGRDRGRAPPCRGHRREARLSRRDGGRALRGAVALRRREHDGGDRACRRSEGLRCGRGRAHQAGRPLPRLDLEPHAARASRSPSSGPNTCCAGSSRERTIGSNS